MHNGPKDHEPHQKVERHNEMAAFDRLSPRLRGVLNHARRNYSAVEVQSLMLDDGCTEDEVIEGLHEAQRRDMIFG